MDARSDSSHEHHRLAQQRQQALLRQYLYEAKYKAEAHGAAEAANRRRDNAASLLQMALSATAGVMSVAAWNNVDACGTSTNIGLIATTAVVSFGVTIVEGCKKVLRFAGKSNAHHAAAGNFQDVASDIEEFRASHDLFDEDKVAHFIDVAHERLDFYNAAAPPIGAAYVAAAQLRVRPPQVPRPSGRVPSTAVALEMHALGAS